MASPVSLRQLQQCESWSWESIYLVCGTKLQLFFVVVSKKPLRDVGFFKEVFVSCLWGALLVFLMSDTVEKKSAVVSDDKKLALVPEDDVQNHETQNEWTQLLGVE